VDSISPCVGFGSDLPQLFFRKFDFSDNSQHERQPTDAGGEDQRIETAKRAVENWLETHDTLSISSGD
jgi:hypothetical protein